MKLISVVYNDVDILPHFLGHYSALGVSSFTIGVYRDAGLMKETRKACRNFDVTLRPIKGEYVSSKDIHFAFRAARKFIEDDEWWIIADVDEFHEFPGPLDKIIAELEAAGNLYLCSRLVERITCDGNCPNIIGEQPIWSQFPASASLRLLTRVCQNKVMLVKGHGGFSGGHHWPERRFNERAAWGGSVHHFKWHGRAIERLTAQIERLKRLGRGYHKTLRHLLDFWLEHKRMPIAGELGFYYPIKPEWWPDWPLVNAKADLA